MATNITRYVPLQTIVAYFQDQYDKSDGDQDRLWILGMRALTELNFDISAQPKTVRLPVESNGTVIMPSDRLSWSKIGLLNEKGEVSTLKINKALTTLQDLSPNRLNALASPDVNDGINTLSGTPIFFNFFDSGYYNNYYGINGGLIQYGECRVDEKNGVIILAKDFKYTSILFEYISSPEMDPDFTVDLALQESVIAFMAWKMKLGTAQDFYSEVKKSRRRLPGKKVTLQEINQVIRESSGGYLHA